MRNRDPNLALAAACWLAAAVVFLGVEALAAYAFSPPYSYARNYISDLGAPACGVIFDGRAICSPLHALMNANFIAQGLLFLVAALAVARSVTTRTKRVFVAFAVLDCLGNLLVGAFPETDAPLLLGTTNAHVLGALLAIVFGNATALVSAWTFRELDLPRVHARLSIALPILAAAGVGALAVASGSGPTTVVPDGVWERTAVYTITTWQILSAACVLRKSTAGPGV